MIEDYAKVTNFPDCHLFKMNVLCENCRDRGEKKFLFLIDPFGMTRCPQCYGWKTKILYGYYIADPTSHRWLFRSIVDVIQPGY